MSSSKSNIVAITEKTAKSLLPKEMRKGGIDLNQLAATARNAIKGSDASLKVAGDIANSGWLARLWNSGEFAKHVVESIGHIRDISKVNLALSAVCNDLAAANLVHAEKIDANHLETSQQLQQVQELTSALLEHLRTARESSLLQPIALALADVDTGDKDALHGWLDSFSEAIDQQYAALQENLQQLAQQQASTNQEVVGFSAELGRLNVVQQAQEGERTRSQTDLLRLSDAVQAQQAREAATLKEAKRVAAALTEQQKQEGRNRLELERFGIALQSHKQEAAGTQKKIEQFDARLQTLQERTTLQQALMSSQISDYEERSIQRSRLLDATVRQSHEKLGAALTLLNTRLETYESNSKHSLDAERKAREEQDTSIRNTLEQRDQAMRDTISALNRYWLKRLFWVTGSLLLLQVAGFVYLSVHIGLWK